MYSIGASNAIALRQSYLWIGQIHHSRRTMSRFALFISALIVLNACGSQESTETAATDSAVDQVVDLRSSSSDDARIYFVNLKDGDSVSSPFQIEFGLEGMDVVPAGTEQENSGHHHLLIDQNELPTLDMPIPSDSVHVHFGLGQTTAELDLTPGRHTLQIILGNHLHIPHNPPVVSEMISIVVE